MGNLDVRIRHGGGGGGDLKGWLVLGGILMLAACGSTVAAAASAVVSALVTLLIVVGCVIGGVLVLGLVLAIVFRDRIRGMMVRRSPAWAVRTEEDGAVPPKTPRPADSKHELHLHFHVERPEDLPAAMRLATLTNPDRVLGPGGPRDPVTGISWDVLEGKVVR